MNDDFRILDVDRQMQYALIRSSLSLPFGATYDVFVSDFKEYYTKKQVMHEYELIKDLEPEYKDNVKFRQWKQALIDVMAWHNGAKLE